MPVSGSVSVAVCVCARVCMCAVSVSVSVVSICVRVCARVCVMCVRAHKQGSVGEQERDQERDSISSVHSSEVQLEEQQMHGMQAYIYTSN